MKVSIKKFQQGGQMATEQPSPEQMAAEQQAAQGGAPQEGGNPEEQLMAMGQQIIQELGPEAAAMLAQIIMEMLQGGGQPQPQPTFQRKGGTLKRKN